MRFEIMPGLPPYGPPAVSFTGRVPEHREGLVVRFYPTRTEPWFGNFLPGATACSAVLEHPNRSDVIVIAGGDTCVVDPETRTIRDWIARDVTKIIPLPLHGLVVFQGLTDFVAVGVGGLEWRSPRISWDGFGRTEIRGNDLLGEAYTPVGDVWVQFKLDLLTGHCSDGTYEQDMARAVLVSVKRPNKD